MPPGGGLFSKQREEKTKVKNKLKEVSSIDTMNEKCNKFELMVRLNDEIKEIKDEYVLAGVTSSQPGVKLVKLFSGRKLPACLKTVI